MAVTLTREQRDALHRTALYELVDASGVERLIREGEAERARQRGLYFSAVFRLLDDLGWSEQDEREAFELTLPPDELTRVAERLIEYADETPPDSGRFLRSVPEDGSQGRSEQVNEALEVRAAATAILEALDKEER